MLNYAKTRSLDGFVARGESTVSALLHPFPGIYNLLRVDNLSNPILMRKNGTLYGRGIGDASINTHRLYSDKDKFIIQMVAVIAASFSVLVSLTTFYWFCRMKKRFRHKVIMLLILGDISRAVCYMVFSIVSFVRGPVRTHSPSCQASGFFTQLGTEMTDVSILFIAVHSALQVFRPRVTVYSPDGLYKYRRYVYACVIIIPVLMSSLAFVNKKAPYMAQGAFCSLPIRPFWYRLALAWIPRYIIALTILGIAIAITIHVRSEHEAFAKVQRQSVSMPSLKDPSPHHNSQRPTVSRDNSNTSTGEIKRSSRENAPNDTASYPKARPLPNRRPSVVGFVDPLSPVPESAQMNRLISIISRPVDMADPAARRKSAASFSTFETMSTISTDETIVASEPQTPHSQHSPDVAQPHVAVQRSKTRRQLRLLFVYPAIYILMWIIPFVLHSLQYSDHWAVHPPFVLVVLVVLCLTSMGAVDCLVFNLREKPWRHIPANKSKSLLGSFTCWDWRDTGNGSDMDGAGAEKGYRRGSGLKAELLAARGRPSSDSYHANPLTSRPGQFRFGSGLSDTQKAETDRAYERLAGEMAERRKMIKSENDGQSKASGGRAREWWDRRQSSLWG